MSNRFDLLPVDRNVVLPPPGRGRPKYPWGSLNVVQGNPPRGDSFLAPCGDDEMEQTMNSLTRCAHKYAYRTGKQFTMRRMKDGVRVWRIR
jgi:hypothetical protein